MRKDYKQSYTFKAMKRGQIWVETVMYTLIAFVMIGLVLGFAKPELEKMQDRAIIEQSIKVLKEIDILILNMGEAGNQRLVKLDVNKGSLEIDAEEDRLVFKVESKYTYCEPGASISDGSLIINNKKIGAFNLINITRDYSTRYNITYEERDELKTINKAAISYTLLISNKGKGRFVDMTQSSCASAINCADKTGFVKACVDVSGTMRCEYTEDRPRLNFEIE